MFIIFFQLIISSQLFFDENSLKVNLVIIKFLFFDEFHYFFHSSFIHSFIFKNLVIILYFPILSVISQFLIYFYYFLTINCFFLLVLFHYYFNFLFLISQIHFPSN